MEEHTKPLEVVCKFFKQEFGDDTITRLRRRLNTAHVANHRLRKRIIILQQILEVERSLKEIYRSFIMNLTRRLDAMSFSLR